MWGPTSDAQDRLISNKIRTEEHTMMSMPEPFLTAEMQYRQLRASALYDKKPSRRRRHWMTRRPSLSLPRPAASLGGHGLSHTAK